MQRCKATLRSPMWSHGSSKAQIARTDCIRPASCCWCWQFLGFGPLGAHGCTLQTSLSGRESLDLTLLQEALSAAAQSGRGGTLIATRTDTIHLRLLARSVPSPGPCAVHLAAHLAFLCIALSSSAAASRGINQSAHGFQCLLWLKSCPQCYTCWTTFPQQRHLLFRQRLHCTLQQGHSASSASG